MTLDEIIARIDAWVAKFAALETEYQAFADQVGAQPDSPLFEAVFRMQEAYTQAVAELIGDGGGWLNWFAFECDLGKKPMGAIVGGTEIRVRTTRQLARAIRSGT